MHGAALWIWHLPALFDLTLSNDAVHALQHFSFLGAALIFWWALIRGHGRRNFAVGVLYLFGAMLHTGLLGAFLTFSQRLWYPVYAGTTEQWGLTPLEDQQLGGLIMWVPACLVYVIAALALAGLLLRREPAPYEPQPAFESPPGE
jgi:cytochrome c oxidase assembly factor CtaG